VALQLFYTPDIEPHRPDCVLSEDESKHAVRVLRLTVGAPVQLVDGRGGLYAGQIAEAHPKRTIVAIQDYRAAYGQRPYRLHMAVAPTKNMDRIEWFLEKATEVGIDEVTPLICEHSERKEIKPDRLYKVMAAAMKQSQKAYLPLLNAARKFDEFVGWHTGSQKFIAHCGEGPKSYLLDHLEPSGTYVILIGPEGDFSFSEIDRAIGAGYLPITLGTARLRTETAALMACLEVAVGNR